MYGDLNLKKYVYPGLGGKVGHLGVAEGMEFVKSHWRHDIRIDALGGAPLRPKMPAMGGYDLEARVPDVAARRSAMCR
jgi:hypothetical protein